MARIRSSTLHARNRGLDRASRLTRLVLGASVVFSGAFTFLAAVAQPGRAKVARGATPTASSHPVLTPSPRQRSVSTPHTSAPAAPASTDPITSPPATTARTVPTTPAAVVPLAPAPAPVPMPPSGNGGALVVSGQT